MTSRKLQSGIESYLRLLPLQVEQINKYHVKLIPFAMEKGHHCYGKIWHFSEYLNYQKKGVVKIGAGWKEYWFTADKANLSLLMLKYFSATAHDR